MRNIRENKYIFGRVASNVHTVCWSSVVTFLYLACVIGPGQSMSYFFGSWTLKSLVPYTFRARSVAHVFPFAFHVYIFMVCFLWRAERGFQLLDSLLSWHSNKCLDDNVWVAAVSSQRRA